MPETPQETNSPGPTKAGAFAAGGCGCLILFLVVGVLCVAVGGWMHIDIIGAVIIFVVGGVLGIAVRAIYYKGRRDAGPPDR